MRVLLFGSDGFIGRAVYAALSTHHDVVGATRETNPKQGYVTLDLLDRSSIAAALKEVRPEAIISCAGIVENTEKADLNPLFTENILAEASASGLTFKRIIISGSAAEYGTVDASNIPVNEDAPLNASAGYGLSKTKEEQVALGYASTKSLPIVVARVFNPIGAGMQPKFLLPKLISQIAEFKAGTREVIEVSRLDSKRDYINVLDVATAYGALLDGAPSQGVYNIGSGQGTSNGELIELILGYSELVSKPKIVESAPDPEALVAIQADITRISSELGWKPAHSIDQTVKEVLDGSK